MTAPSLPLHPISASRAPAPSNALSVLPPLPPSASGDGLTPAQRHWMIGAIVVGHAAGAWGLMQIGAVREAVREAAPMFVDLIASASPPAPPAPPVPPAPKPAPAVAKIAPPRPVIAAAPSPAPDTFVAPEPLPEPVVVTAAPPVVATPAPVVAASAMARQAPVLVASPPVAAPPPAKDLPASSVQYASTVAPDYPRLSRRNAESGRVMVRVFIDETGAPRQVQLAGSSGFERLDASALAAVLRFRFEPPVENGQRVSGWANVPIDFGLEK